MTALPPSPSDIGGFDPAVARALDRYIVPAPSEDFLDRLAMIPAAPPLQHSMPPARRRFRRSVRGPWLRRSVISLVAFGLASATAAAAGVFDSFHFDIPVIAKLFAPVAPPVRVAVLPPRQPHTARRPLAPPRIVPPPDPAPAPLTIARAARLERFRTLPMPVRAMATERIVTRIKRRLAWRGVDVPRAIIRARVMARTGQTDLPSGTPMERRAQWQAALMAAPAGSLPPRLEMLRYRMIHAGRARSFDGQAVDALDQRVSSQPIGAVGSSAANDAASITGVTGRTRIAGTAPLPIAVPPSPSGPAAPTQPAVPVDGQADRPRP
ncbi:hypothetical protein [Sphingomonas sp. 28-63-12]|uniref:hypothetical protein n=1 Tax=Sphingomonas sp. 28-63-12 TaxID=1970434 RepID=UPI000BDDA904|nr:MAG: hypothetical protein B7Y47_00580 [Sphingomonas sp. 28-63-12]